MSQARFQETLRRLAIFDERFVPAGLAGDPAGPSVVCLQWSIARAQAVGATQDEVADVLLAIAPVAGLGRVVSAAPDLATALGYDIAAALEEPGDH